MLIFNDENWKCDVKSAAATDTLLWIIRFSLCHNHRFYHFAAGVTHTGTRKVSIFSLFEKKRKNDNDAEIYWLYFSQLSFCFFPIFSSTYKDTKTDKNIMAFNCKMVM